MLTSEKILPENCVHDFDGPAVLFNAKGETFQEHQVPDHDTDPEAYELFYKENKIIGGACTCIHCGSLFHPNINTSET